MGCSTRTKGVALSLIHLMLGVLGIVFGVVSIKLEEANYNNGLYGMGIWIGIWMLLTCLLGLLTSSKQPLNKCRVTCFIGFCCYSIVALLVCCIPLIVGPINYFSFEAKADKEYYKQYGPPSMYHKPVSYFEEKNRIGRIGCTVYSAILCVILLDIIIAAASCYVWKHAMSTFTTPRRGRHVFVGSINTGYNHSVSFISSEPVGVLQDGFVIDSQYPKLPSYRDIYPDGSPTWENPPSLSNNQAPPPYTETATSIIVQDENHETSNGGNDDQTMEQNTTLEDPPMLNTPFNDVDRSTTISEPQTLNGPNDDHSIVQDLPMINTQLDDNGTSTMTADPSLSGTTQDNTSNISAIRNSNSLSDVSSDDPPAYTISDQDPTSSTLRFDHSTPNNPLENPPVYSTNEESSL